MRLFIQIWMLLALLLVEKNFVKAQGDPDLVFAEGSGVVDDEDYVTDAPGEMGEQGSGATEGTPIRSSEGVVAKVMFDNTIRIHKIGDKKAVFEPAHEDPESTQSMAVFESVCTVILASLQTNELTSQAEECVGVSITAGSLVVKTEITFSEDTTADASDVESAIKSSLAGNTLGDSTTTLTVDKKSIKVVPTGSEDVDVATERPTKKPGNIKPNKSEPTPDMMPTSISPDNNGLSDNEIFFDTSPPMKPSKSTTMSNEIGNNVHNNKLEVKDKKEKQNFFQMVIGSPVLLAALVGAVVLTLITIVLITMFLIYRVKKKDEGSYSLDEPHKVKDPTAYWKDTKEFYA